MYRLIGLTGYSGVGKDEAAKGLLKQGYRRVAFADALRDVLYALNPIVFTGPLGFGKARVQSLVDRIGWPEAQRYSEVRELLQRMGTDAGRKILGKNIWVETALKTVAEGEKIVITDVRFDDEAKAIIALGGTVVKIERPGVGPVNGHESENLPQKKYVDYTIYNLGSKELLQQRLQAISYGAT